MYTARDILTHIEDQLDDWQDKLSKSNARLLKIKTRILEFKRDTSLNYIPTESALRNQYIEQLSVLNTKFSKLETVSRKKFLNVGLLQNRVVQNYVKITDYKNEINGILDKFGDKAISEGYPYIWKSSGKNYPNSFTDAYRKTVKMNQRLLTFFVISNHEIHLLGILLLAAFFY